MLGVLSFVIRFELKAMSKNSQLAAYGSQLMARSLLQYKCATQQKLHFYSSVWLIKFLAHYLPLTAHFIHHSLLTIHNLIPFSNSLPGLLTPPLLIENLSSSMQSAMQCTSLPQTPTN